MGYDTPWAEALDPHGALEALAPNLWWVWSVLRAPPLPRNMVVVRLPDGRLLLHSPVCLGEAEMASLDALGPAAFLLVPNAGHRTDLRRYRARYPDARVLAPANARAQVEQVAPVDATCEAELPGLGIEVHRPDGMKEGYELVYEVPLEGGGRALLVNDVIATPHPRAPTGLKGWIVGALGVPGGGVGLPRIVWFNFGQDREAFRGFVRRLADRPDLRVLTCSHGGPLTSDVAGALRAAAERL